ncbi:16S rRNA (cytosine(1407)-C(5))-methyltransferase RsmF [Vibrio marisflavi]|uniref:Ribosomal RNA small subunit methyltransferase F n=1 Tax=Vibrio marisflavi CECT 7928 TaxID=634439 RepID=A0ABN8E3D6_9VIBR|nr:16S rRNA (cytosine(1407)-C(5))-methyltransferase RsmF [Vibrio marisflavi]CAH0539764.1 Ribosomal RNA small subunit methyltransferase F [Vibrio marisflavi CECT 7928]
MHPNVYLPEEFLSHIEAILPEGESLSEFVSACQRPLRKSIRVNTLKTSVENFKQRAKHKGWKLEPIPWCDTGFWIEADESVTPLGNTAEHMAGLFYIQEASSMMPVSALFHQQDSNFGSVLDMASAPGSKTTQIAAKQNNKGVIVANELSASRVKVLHANIQRCGVSNCALTNFDGNVFGGWLPEQFDAVLLDAPCSGEGTVRKDPDALKNWSIESTNTIADVQKQLIESAFHALKPGGSMVYSTCALSKEENQQVCTHLLTTFTDAIESISLLDLFPDAHKALTPEGYVHIFPQTYDCEGFFVARFRKLSSVTPPAVKKRLGKFPFEKANTKLVNQISQSLDQELNIVLQDDSMIWARDKEVWLFPTNLEPMLGELRFSRMGIKIAETHKNGFKWQHQVATSVATGKEDKCLDIDVEQAREWFMGRDIRPNGSGKGSVLVRYDGFIIGLGKWVGNRIKNGLPRELVRDKNLF